VVNAAEAQQAVQASITEAQRYLGSRIPSAYVSISGRHVTCHTTTGLMQTSIQNGPVSLSDVQRLIETSHPEVAAEKEIIHVIPVNYTIDGSRGVRNPVGLHAGKLEVECQVVLADRGQAHDTIKAVEACGVTVRSLVLSALASSEVALSEHEKEMGVVLVDIGAGTTDLAIFRHGGLWHYSSIPVGGNHLTKDLSVALGMPNYFAEELKAKWGHAHLNEEQTKEEAMLPSFQGQSRRLVRRSSLCQPLLDRLQETLGLIMVRCQQAGLSHFPAAGVVITGGTAEMPGLREMAQKILGCPVRIGSPEAIRGLSEDQKKPSYSTVVGLLLWGVKHHGERRVYSNGDGTQRDQKSIFQRVKEAIVAR
jgi:cell division protein FtsA